MTGMEEVLDYITCFSEEVYVDEVNDGVSGLCDGLDYISFVNKLYQTVSTLPKMEDKTVSTS